MPLPFQKGTHAILGPTLTASFFPNYFPVDRPLDTITFGFLHINLGNWDKYSVHSPRKHLDAGDVEVHDRVMLALAM